MATDLIVIGGGEHAQVIIETALLMPDSWNVIGFTDSQKCEETTARFAIPHLGSDRELKDILQKNKKAKVVVAVGEPIEQRQKIVAALSLDNERWATIIHPSAVISPNANIGAGVVILSRVIVQTGSVVGAHAIVNNGAVIEHDVAVGAFTHITPGVVTGGKCAIGQACHIGLGARIRDHITIGDNAVVGTGAVVVTDIPDGETVVGVPARRLTRSYDMHNVDVNDICVRAETTLYEAMSILGKYGTMIIFVTDAQKRLLGVLTYGDIRDALLDHNDVNQPIKNFMSENYHSVTSNVSRVSALEQMKALGINRMPVLDDEGRVVGLHLVESLIGSLNLPNTVVIMAGGKGERLRPLTSAIPKPMIKVAGRPILEHSILHLSGCGLNTFFIAVNYLSDVIENHFNSGEAYGCAIDYLREKEPLGTAGALSLIETMPEHPIIILNGDLITHFSPEKILHTHACEGNSMTVGVYNYNVHIPYGVVEVDEKRIKTIHEKPKKHFLVNSGIYVVEPHLIQNIPPERAYDMTQFIQDLMSANEKVGVHLIESDWVDIAREKDLVNAGGLNSSLMK